MDTNGFDIGYLHVEDLYYAEYDHEGEQVGDTMHLIGDGCSMVGPLIEMKGFLVSSRSKKKRFNSDRTEKNTEQFFLTPFQIEDQAAESFKLSATLTACPFGESGELCGLAFNCQNRYPTSFFPSVMVTSSSVMVVEHIFANWTKFYFWNFHAFVVTVHRS